MSDPAPCPPHHWLIEGQPPSQVWTCKRCGAAHVPPAKGDPDAIPPWQGRGRRGVLPPSAPPASALQPAEKGGAAGDGELERDRSQ